jgi:hypothetical protein
LLSCRVLHRDRARGGKPAQLTLGAVPPAHAPGSARPGALTHHSWSCLSSRGCPWGCRGLGLGTPSRSDNARPREGVPGSTDHGLEKPAGGGLLPVGRTSGEAAACGLEPAHRLWRRRGGPAGMEDRPQLTARRPSLRDVDLVLSLFWRDRA